jgi:hypothetical protein
MWRETNVFGVYMSPLIVYSVVALLLWIPLRYGMLRLRLHLWVYNPSIAHLAVYLMVLAALVTWL